MRTECDRLSGLPRLNEICRSSLALGVSVAMMASSSEVSAQSACLPTSGPIGVREATSGSVRPAVAAPPCLDRAQGCLPSKLATDSLPRPTAAPAQSASVNDNKIELRRLPDLSTARSTVGCDAASSPNCRPQQAATQQVADEDRARTLAKAVAPTKVNGNSPTLPNLNAEKVLVSCTN